ncbi:MAG: class I SAM-dependent methyltransferase [Acidobacteriota bacterium]
MGVLRSILKRVLTLTGLLRPLRALRGWLGRTRISETSKCRASLAPFCTGDGIDVGYGGDPIVPHAICMDLETPYARYAKHPQHLHGDARDLTWFADGSLDFVYSSHVLEDFEDTAAVLDEWLRVLGPGGRLVLYLPDEPTYREHCRQRGKPPNAHHIHDDFGPETLRRIVAARPNLEITHFRFPVGIYSFEMVIEKGE